MSVLQETSYSCSIENVSKPLEGIQQNEGEVECVVTETDVSGMYWFLMIGTKTFFLLLCVRSFLLVVVVLAANGGAFDSGSYQLEELSHLMMLRLLIKWPSMVSL